MKKNYFMKKTLLATALLVISQTAAMAQSIGYGLYSGTEDFESWGTDQIEDYDMAIYIPGEFAGMTVESISVPYGTNQLDNGSFWATTELLLDEDGKNKPNIVLKELDFKSQDISSWFTTVSFDTPVTIPAEGLYVGYSFSVTEESGWYGNCPTLVVETDKSNFFYMRSSITHKKWGSRYDEKSGKGLAITAYLNGGLKNAATFSALNVGRAEIGNSGKVEAELANFGSMGIQSVLYRWDVNGQSGTGEIEANVPAHYGKTQSVVLDLPALETGGAYPFTVTIEKVNTVDNEADNEMGASNNSTYYVYDEKPAYRPLFEAYEMVTDGFCWRTFVGMDNMRDKFGNDFPGLIYFRAGDLSIATDEELPAYMPYIGVPNGYINRNHLVDPYTGGSLVGECHFGFDKRYEEECDNFCIASISAKACFSDADCNNVGVLSKVEFPFGELDADYAVGYVLTADGIEYDKSIPNNYQFFQDYVDEDMSEYTYGPENIYHTVINSVAVAMSPVPGVDDSLPSTIEDKVEYTHDYTFDISKNEIIQDKKKLNVIAFIIDRKSGYVINSCKTQVLDYDESGVDEIAVESTGRDLYYSIEGRRLSSPQKGLNIVIRANGTREKVII